MVDQFGCFVYFYGVVGGLFGHGDIVRAKVGIGLLHGTGFRSVSGLVDHQILAIELDRDSVVLGVVEKVPFTASRSEADFLFGDVM